MLFSVAWEKPPENICRGSSDSKAGVARMCGRERAVLRVKEQVAASRSRGWGERRMRNLRRVSCGYSGSPFAISGVAGVDLTSAFGVESRPEAGPGIAASQRCNATHNALLESQLWKDNSRT